MKNFNYSKNISLRKTSKVLLFFLLLPVTLFLDLILYALVRNCSSCGTFSQWLEREGALSFPLVIGIVQWLESLFPKWVKPSK